MVLRYMFDADGIQNVPHREWLLDFKQAIDDVRSVLKEQCRGDEFVGAKVGEWTRYRETWVTSMTTTDHIHYFPWVFCRGNRVVPGRLHCLKARIS